MKLKVRVKKKDFFYFVLICIVLFIGCMILSINFISFGENGTLAGINIKEHFSWNALWLALIIFFCFLAFIFMNVSSTIFDLDKGFFGITFKDKEEKGYNRWTTLKEMKQARSIKPVQINAPTSDAGGIVLINNGKKMWVDDGEYHTLIIGQSGSGKTSALVDPQVYSLCKHGESMVITDPKGEIYRRHANRLKAKGYKLIVINFRDPREGNAWNPLTIPYRMFKQGKIDKAQELLEDISQNIFISPKNSNDPFWESSSSSYFAGLGLGLFEDAKENEVNISSIEYMSSCGEDKNGISTFAKDYFTLKGESSNAYKYAKATITAPSETKSSILSVFQDKIKNFASRPELSEMLSYSDFNMEDIGKEKTAVFLIVHDEKTTYHSLATIFIKQLYEVLIDVAHKNPNGELKYRTNFILDEFANMPALKDVTSMVTAARSRKIRFTFIIQNFAQLDEVYGDKNAETIRSNCGNTIYLLTNELSALEEISKLCGEVKSKEKEKTVSTPLVTVTDLQKMKMNEIIVIRMRMRPFRTVLKGAYEVDWGEKYDEALIPERETHPVKLFDMKQYVKEEKRKKTMEAINSAQADAPKEEIGTPGVDIPKKAPSPFNTSDKPVDIDELVKNIDAQIAELEREQEEEDRKKKESSTTQSVNASSLSAPASSPILANPQTKTIETQKVSETPSVEKTAKESVFPIIDNRNVLKNEEPVKKENETKSTVMVDNSSVVVDNQIVTDDQFFDDFFGDDDY